jgi:hypothetical protein
MKKRKMPGGSGRDLLSSHRAGAGKGDAPRYRHDANWLANYDEIDWHRVEECAGKKFFKRYGKANPKTPEFLEPPPVVAQPASTQP